MNRMIFVLLLLVCGSALAADDASPLEAKLKAAMESDIRSEKEVERDRNRKPLETLEFFGLRDDMKVVELLPGGGWYTIQSMIYGVAMFCLVVQAPLLSFMVSGKKSKAVARSELMPD